MTSNSDKSISEPHPEKTNWPLIVIIGIIILIGGLVLFTMSSRGSKTKYAMASASYELMDPSSAQFRNVKVIKGDFVCGEINAKNSYGAYTGYRWFMVKHPDSDTASVLFEDGILGPARIIRNCANHPNYDPVEVVR